MAGSGDIEMVTFFVKCDILKYKMAHCNFCVPHELSKGLEKYKTRKNEWKTWNEPSKNDKNLERFRKKDITPFSLITAKREKKKLRWV